MGGMKYAVMLLFILLITGILLRMGYTANAPGSTLPRSPAINPTGIIDNISAGRVPDIPFYLPPGYVIHVFAGDLVNPRDMVLSAGGTLLVSDIGTNSVIALPDQSHLGTAQAEKTVINSGNHIHGLAFYRGKLYVAEVDKIVRYDWDEQHLQVTFDKTLFSLPENSDHNNRTMAFDNHGNLYVSVGSTCNVCREQSDWSGTVIVSDADGKTPHIFASGLRNAAFIMLNPDTGELWGTEMGRDYLGDSVPPDEINIIRSGINYGWPYCYGNKVHDDNFDPGNGFSCDTTEPPVFNIPAHSAPLGLVFIRSSQFPQDWQNDLLVAYHGSWNRSEPDGYKIVHLKVHGNTITHADDFMTGFLQNGSSLGRPVDLVFNSNGDLYVSDDKAGTVYIIQKRNT